MSFGLKMAWSYIGSRGTFPVPLETVPLRRPPKVSGQIRVVEVEAFDYSACGGTHCLNTGMIGLIKIVKTSAEPSISLHLLGNDVGCVLRHRFEPATGKVAPFHSGYTNQDCQAD